MSSKSRLGISFNSKSLNKIQKAQAQKLQSAAISTEELSEAKGLISLLSKFIDQQSTTSQRLAKVETDDDKEDDQEQEPPQTSGKKAALVLSEEGSDSDSDNQSKIKLVMEHQDEFESFDNYKDLEYEEMCKIKQGYVSEIINVEGNLLHGRPVFAVLNEKTIAIFENENVNALIKTIDLLKLDYPLIPQQWKDFHCIQLKEKVGPPQEQDISNVIDEITNAISVDEAELSFCTTSKTSMYSWVRAIIEFHNCEVKVVGSGNSTYQNIDDYKQAVQQQIEAKQIQLQRAQDQKDMEDLDQQQMNSDKEQLIDKMCQSMRDNLKKEKAREEKQKRLMDQKRDKLIKDTEKMQQEEECLQRALQAKGQEEAHETEMLIQEEANQKEEALMCQATQMMIQESQKEADKILMEEEKLNDEQLQMQEHIRELMVKETTEFEKNMDASQCYAADLAGEDGPNEEYIKEICGQIVTEPTELNFRRLHDCLNLRTFCNSCCNIFIGQLHEPVRYECVGKCKKKIFGDESTTSSFGQNSKDSFNIEVPVLQKIYDGKETLGPANLRKQN